MSLQLWGRSLTSSCTSSLWPHGGAITPLRQTNAAFWCCRKLENHERIWKLYRGKVWRFHVDSRFILEPENTSLTKKKKTKYKKCVQCVFVNKEGNQLYFLIVQNISYLFLIHFVACFRINRIFFVKTLLIKKISIAQDRRVKQCKWKVQNKKAQALKRRKGESEMTSKSCHCCFVAIFHYNFNTWQMTKSSKFSHLMSWNQ